MHFKFFFFSNFILLLHFASSENFGINPTIPKPPIGLSSNDLPYPYYPSTATSANIIMDASHIKEWGGSDADRVVVDIKSQGPIPWCISHFNRGDLSLSIGPRHPYSQTNLGVLPSFNGFSTSNPKDFSAQAWRPSPEKGVLLSTVAQNGQTWNDGTPGFYGTVASVLGHTGYGYSMITGEFGNVQPSIDVTVGKAGKLGEGNIDVSVAWFPYDQGWVGGYVSAPKGKNSFLPQWQTTYSHSSHFSREIGKYVYWNAWGASLHIPFVDSMKDGMLFATSTDPGKDNDDVNTVSLYSKKSWGGGWKIQQREDDQLDVFEFTNMTQLMFGFVYIPFSAGGLTGGNINGRSGKKMGHSGNFESYRIGQGQYEIRIIEQKSQKNRQKEYKTDQDGSLLLQVIGREDNMFHLSKHAFLSYNYSNNGKFIVEARHMAAGNNGDEIFPLIDSDFSFVWLDFKKPPTPTKETYTGYQDCPKSTLGFWTGFFFCLTITLVALTLSYIAFLQFKARLQPSPFVFRPQKNDGALDTELLHSDFRFGD